MNTKSLPVTFATGAVMAEGKIHYLRPLTDPVEMSFAEIDSEFDRLMSSGLKDCVGRGGIGYIVEVWSDGRMIRGLVWPVAKAWTGLP